MRVVEGWWTVDEVDLLIQHINGLSGLEIIGEPIEPYEHMGALLIDCVFQAGISYNTVVKPRVDRVYEDYPEAITTSAFLKVLQREGSDKVARWKPSRKTETLEALTKLLVDENVESEEELQHWLLRDDAREKLACIKGIGPKTIDYMAVLAGIPTIAIDVHMRRFLEEAGITSGTYENAHTIFQAAARRLGVDPVALDHSIWMYMSNRGRQ